jgi:hypothetical protein
MKMIGQPYNAAVLAPIYIGLRKGRLRT